MRILIDILHPAHVHFFRNFYEVMAGRGHELTITARDKDRSVDLLEQYGLPYEQISVQKSGGVGLVTEMTPAHAGAHADHGPLRAGRDDRDHGPVDRRSRGRSRRCRQSCSTTRSSPGRRTGSCIRSPTASSRRTATRARFGARTAGTPGTTSSRTSTRTASSPTPAKLAAFGIEPGEQYSIVRFVSWEAVHDRRETGFTAAQKRDLVATLGRHGRVLISSEARAAR